MIKRNNSGSYFILTFSISKKKVNMRFRDHYPFGTNIRTFIITSFLPHYDGPNSLSRKFNGNEPFHHDNNSFIFRSKD